MAASEIRKKIKVFGKRKKTLLKKYSINEYNNSLSKAEEEIMTGKYLTHEQAANEILKW